MNPGECGISHQGQFTPHAVRIFKPQRTKCAEVIDRASACAAVDQSFTKFMERDARGGRQGNVIEVPSFEHARHRSCMRTVRGLDRMQPGVGANAKDCVMDRSALPEDNLRLEDPFIECDETLQVRRNNRDVVQSAEKRHGLHLLLKETGECLRTWSPRA